MNSIFLRLAKSLYRTPEEARAVVAPETIRVKDVLFYSALAVLFLIFMPLAYRQFVIWGQNHVDFEVPAATWHAVYSESPPCSLEGSANASTHGRCLSNPENPTLWNSKQLRSAKEHKAKVDARRFKEFWIGTVVPPALLKAAAAGLANQFVLGFVRGTYRVWFDGDYIIGGKWADNEPVILAVPIGRLKAGRPLHIAIQIINDAEVMGLPDALAPSFGTGFAKKENATSWRRMQTVWLSSRPAALFFANLILSLIFFLVWSASREKQENFYIACYAFMSALVQLKLVDVFFLSLSRPALNTYGMVVIGYYSIFSMFVGFSFARMRPAVFTYGVPLALLVPPMIAALIRDPVSQQTVFAYFYQELGAFFAVLGAASCFIQAWLLFRQRNAGIALPVRERRLIIFGAVLTALAVLCAFDDGPWQTVWTVFAHRTGNVILLLVLGVIALRDYQEERQLIDKAPVSPYHRRPIVPSSVNGAMLVIDLKNSERLFRLGAELGRGGELVDTCISHMWDVVAGLKGVIIQTDGDLIRAFFDENECANPALAALDAIDGVFKRMRGLELHLREQFSIGEDFELEFRAVVSDGSIRPIWHEIGTVRYAGWIEAGTSNVFVETARLLDLDHYLPTKSSAAQTRAVLAEPLAARLCGLRPELAGRYTARNLALKGKHGREYIVAFYLPVGADRRELKRVA